MTISPHTFSNDSISYIAPSWEELQELVFTVSKQLLESGATFDRLITLAKGGWPHSRALVDYLQIPDVASIGIKFYKDIAEKYDQPEVYQPLPHMSSSDKVLLFDDVADSGTSLEFTVQHLQNQGVEDITTVTLFYKQKSSVVPDYYGAETDAWIVFPFEVRETISALHRRWLQHGVSKNEMLDRFVQLGFRKTEIDFFLSVLELSN